MGSSCVRAAVLNRALCHFFCRIPSLFPLPALFRRGNSHKKSHFIFLFFLVFPWLLRHTQEAGRLGRILYKKFFKPPTGSFWFSGHSGPIIRADYAAELKGSRTRDWGCLAHSGPRQLKLIAVFEMFRMLLGTIKAEQSVMVPCCFLEV